MASSPSRASLGLSFVKTLNITLKQLGSGYRLCFASYWFPQSLTLVMQMLILLPEASKTPWVQWTARSNFLVLYHMFFAANCFFSLTLSVVILHCIFTFLLFDESILPYFGNFAICMPMFVVLPGILLWLETPMHLSCYLKLLEIIS